MERTVLFMIVFTIIAYLIYNNGSGYESIKSEEVYLISKGNGIRVSRQMIFFKKNRVIIPGGMLHGEWESPGLFVGLDEHNSLCTIEFNIVASEFPQAMPTLEVDINLMGEQYKMKNCTF